MRIEMDQEDKAAELLSLEKSTKRLWAKDRHMEARQKARDVRMTRVEYTRLGKQKANIISISGKMHQLRSGTAVEENLEFYVRAMGERMATSHPARFARVLERCDQLNNLETMTNELLDDYFAEEEQAERDRDTEEVGDDKVVEDVLIKLGCVVRIEDAPSVPIDALSGGDVPPPPPPPKGGGGGTENASELEHQPPDNRRMAITTDGRIVYGSSKKNVGEK